MPRNALLETNTVSFSELLGNGRLYQVPPYQRDYSWREENWEDLWNDILDLRREEEKQHYMGALVVQSAQDNKNKIIDGQQRLTTLSVFALAVIRRLQDLIDAGETVDENRERVDILRRSFIGDKDPASLLYSSKLFLNDTNNDFYQSVMVQLRQPRALGKLADSNKLLWKAFLYFYEKLETIEGLVADGRELAGFLTNVVAARLLFIRISVEDELSAYTVFETLNARGVELTASDLLKNYLFSLAHADEEVSFVSYKWSRVADMVGSTSLPEFLRSLINSQQSYVRQQRLFRTVKERVRSGADVVNLLEELEEEADVYTALFDATHELWRGDREARKRIRALRLFNVRQFTSLLLAVYRRFNRTDFNRILRLLEVISFRYNVIGALNPNELERAYNQAAVALHRREIDTVDVLAQSLRSIYVADEDFKTLFENKVINTTRRKKLVRYILYTLEADASGNALDFEDDPGTIEHILPENPEADWHDFGPPDLQDLAVYRLGNYTLLEDKLNKLIGRSTYSRKKEAYARSSYVLNQSIQAEDWTLDAIARRQERLAARAVHLWRWDGLSRGT